MSPDADDPDGDRDPGPEVDSATSHVDARGAKYIQVGENNVQIVQVYGSGGGQTWTDGVAARPLVSVSGKIDSPYRGLNAFSERDSAFFFGRDTAADQVLERMSRHLDGRGPLMVSGASGAGKSSLVQAGVISKVRAHGVPSVPESASWPCVVLTPTSTPLQELALRMGSVAGIDAAGLHLSLAEDPERFVLTAHQTALSGREADADGAGQQRTLIVVDQFEQIFTQCRSEDERRAFITALHAAATTTDGGPAAALVVLVVRADFEARCGEYEQLAGAAQDRFLVTPMTPLQLRLAITEPAKVAGSGVDDDLVEVLLDEVAARGSSPGGDAVAWAGVLPLLSHALDQAWRGRAGPSLTLADYERTGGIEGAVAASAQRAYGRLTLTRQQAARHVFIRLTATSSDGINTATRLARSDLTQAKTTAEVGDIEAVLESFAAERLLTLAHETVEISHEVLLTAWPLLRDEWLAETQADRIIRTRLRTTATEWHTHRQDSSYLYSGSLLNDATQAAARTETDPARHPPLTATEKEFLTASTRAQHRTNRRRQSFTASLIALVIALTSALGIAYRISQNATRQRDSAISNRLIQSALSADTDPGTVKQQALIARQLAPHSPDARYAMLNAAANPGLATLTGTGSVHSVAFSPDGKILAIVGYGRTVRLWNVASHRQTTKPFVSNDSVSSVAFSPDGKTLAIAGEDRAVRLWDVASHRQTTKPFFISGDSFASVAFSPDGKTLATAGGDVQLWDVTSHRQINTLTSVSSLHSVAFSPDGKTLAAGSDTEGSVRMWDVARLRPVKSLLISDRSVDSVAFSPDGKTLATASFQTGGAVRLWDVASHRQIKNPLISTGPAESVAFSPDGKTLATASEDNIARLWDVASYRQIKEPFISDSSVESMVFSPDGKILATGGGHTVRLWDIASHRQSAKPFISDDSVESVVFSPDGKILATGGGHSVRLWDVASQRPIKTLPTSTNSHDSVRSVAFSPDGKTLAAAVDANGAVGFLRLWDVASRRPIKTPLTSDIPLLAVAFSPDGKTLATGDLNGAAQLWDVASRRPTIKTPLTSGNELYSVAFSPDGKTLATGSYDNTARLWDVASRRPINTPLTSDSPVVSVVFSPDGKTLATAVNGTAQLWDVASHRRIKNLIASDSQLNSVAFSPDGKTLATASDDNTARLWDLDYLNDAFQHLCDRIGQTITPTVWKQYVQSGPAYQKVCP